MIEMKYSRILSYVGLFFYLFVPVIGFSEVRTYFSPKGGAENQVIQHILSARKSIDIAMYSFTSKSILGALEELKKKHPEVKIRMVFNDAANQKPDAPGGKSQALRSQEFEMLAIDVRMVSKIMHHKFMIVDGFPQGLRGDEDFSNTILFTGSGNFSSSAENRYDENFLEIKNESFIITEFQKEFELMWNYSADFPTGTSFKNPKEYLGKIKPSSFLSPIFTSQNFKENLKFDLNGNRVVSQIFEEAILRAKKSIYVATGHFRFKPLADALIKAQKLNPKLDIRVIVDSQEYVTKNRHAKHMQDYENCYQDIGSDPSEDDIDTCELKGGYELSRYLSDAQIPLRLKYYSYKWYYPLEPQMHHKYMVIDGDEVFTGSYNWSKNAEFNTFENIVYIRGENFSSIVDSFLENFFKLWELNRDRIELHKDNLKNQNRVPLHFSPLSLSIVEVDEIRGLLNEEIPGFFKNAKPEHRTWDKRKGVGEE